MGKFIIKLLFVTVLYSAVLAKDMYVKDKDQDICRALSLSGGGSKGAYEVGVLHQMSRMLNGTDA